MTLPMQPAARVERTNARRCVAWLGRRGIWRVGPTYDELAVPFEDGCPQETPTSLGFREHGQFA